jgi:hypothetical protein
MNYYATNKPTDGYEMNFSAEEGDECIVRLTEKYAHVWGDEWDVERPEWARYPATY